MKSSTDHILTSHTGSLPRPQGLIDLLVAQQRGESVPAAMLEEETAKAVREVVRRQVECGISVVNDGEQSKFGFSTYFRDRLHGFETRDGRYESPFDGLPAGERRTAHDFPGYFLNLGWHRGRLAGEMRPVTECVGPVSWKAFDLVERDIRNLSAAVEEAGGAVEEAFMSAISPGTLLLANANRYYASIEEYLFAVGDVLRDEYRAIIDAGLILQLDCPDLGVHLLEGEAEADAAGRRMPFSIEQFRREMMRNIEALNYATRGLPPDRMRVHVCWGSSEHPHHLDPELKDMVDLLLTCRADGLTIVAANGRHEHEWRVWEGIELPEGKVIVPGVIDSTTNIVEHPELVAERIVRFAGVLGREHLVAGVDCGFQPAATRNQIDSEVAWAKLRSLGDGARLASQELGSRQAVTD